MFWCTKSVKFHFRWGTKSRDQKQETGNDCGLISGLQASQKTDFSDIFLFSYKQRTIVSFLSELINSQWENDWEICFREAWSPEMTSQSFPVSCFWSRGFVPHRKWNLTLLVHQNMGKESCYRNFFFAMHISTLRRFNGASKKNLSYMYTLWRNLCLLSSRLISKIQNIHVLIQGLHNYFHQKGNWFYSAFTETRATQTMKTNQKAELKQ